MRDYEKGQPEGRAGWATKSVSGRARVLQHFGIVENATAFDPATLALTLYLDGANYNPATGLWTGEASAGTSGVHNATTAGADPTAGTALNGIQTVSFSASSSQRLVLPSLLSVYVAADAFSAWALVNLVSESVDGVNYTVSDAIFADVGGYMSIGMRPTGPYHGATIYTGATEETTFTNGTWQLLQVRYDGVNLQVRTNAGAWVSTASTNIVLLTSACLLGSNYNHTHTINGLLASFGVAATSFDDATFENLRKGLNARFALSL